MKTDFYLHVWMLRLFLRRAPQHFIYCDRFTTFMLILWTRKTSLSRWSRKTKMCSVFSSHPHIEIYWVSFVCSNKSSISKVTCCVSVQGLDPSEEHLKANYVTTLWEGCPNLKAPPDAPSFPCFCDPSWPHISQDTFCTRKRRTKERKWWHRVA